MNRMKWLACGLAVALAAAMTACSGASDMVGSSTSAAAAEAAYAPPMEGSYEYEMDVAEDSIDMDDAVYEEPQVTGGGGLGDGGVEVRNQSSDTRKIVITVNLSLQTMDFEGGTNQIIAFTEEYGGYIQDSYVEGSNLYDKYLSRSASYTVRVPTDRLNAFLGSLGGAFNVVHQQQSSQDISNDYFDSKARLESLRVQEERLMAMLKEADELEYLFQVERELANVLYEIEVMTSSINRMDDSVNLSTVTVHLQEVVEYENIQAQPATFGERVRETLGDSWLAFVDFCENTVLFFIALIPFLPVIAVLVVIIVVVLRISRKNKRRRAAQSQSFTPVYPMPQPPVQPGVPPSPEGDKPDSDA